MRFGIFVPQGWRLDLAGIEPADQWAVMRDLAQAADRGPWESLWVYDHFHTVPEPTEDATHEAWSLMSAFGAVTERIRLGQMCTCMGYRNPAYLAKVAATADIVSGGRSRWASAAAGTSTSGTPTVTASRRAGQRLAMLDEGVQIMRELWTSGTATLVGKHYQVRGAICRPLPVAGRRHPAVDRRRRREEDAAHRGEVCAVHELRRDPGDLPPQVRGARAALQGRRHRFRGDHPVRATTT